MADTYIFVVDVGTSSLKAAIMDRNLNIIEHAQGHYAYSVVENMGVEIDPEDIWNAFVKVARMFSSYADQIDVIALCTFCPAMTPMEVTLAECQKHIHLRKSVFLTGGGANEALKHYKEQTVFSGYTFTLRKECSLVGVAKLARIFNESCSRKKTFWRVKSDPYS